MNQVKKELEESQTQLNAAGRNLESKVEEAKRAAEQACAETAATAEKRTQGIQIGERVFWLYGGNDAMLEGGDKAIWPFDVLGKVVGKADTKLDDLKKKPTKF